MGALDLLTHRVPLAEAPANLAPRVDLLAAAPALKSLDPSLPLPWASRRFRSADCR